MAPLLVAASAIDCREGPWVSKPNQKTEPQRLKKHWVHGCCQVADIPEANCSNRDKPSGENSSSSFGLATCSYFFLFHLLMMQALLQGLCNRKSLSQGLLQEKVPFTGPGPKLFPSWCQTAFCPTSLKLTPGSCMLTLGCARLSLTATSSFFFPKAAAKGSFKKSAVIKHCYQTLPKVLLK